MYFFILEESVAIIGKLATLK